MKRIAATIRIKLLMFVISSLVCVATIAADNFRAEQLRASFLFHIAHFTVYPTQVFTGNQINFCFLEDKEFRHAKIFKEAPTKKVQDRAINLIEVADLNALQQENCQILFVSEEKESDPLFSTLDTLNQNLVSIGETQDFTDRGGMISIMPLRSKMKIYFSRDEYEQTSLKFSSLFLKRVKFR